MAHAVSSSTLRFEHMSPTAAGLAATLHALLAAFLLWGTTAKNLEVPEQAIEVTMEEPPAKSEAPKTEPTPQPTPPPPAAQTPPATQPAPPVEAKPTVTDKTKTTPLGMAPPKERTNERPAEPPQVAAAQPPPPKEAPPPEPTPPAETKLPEVAPPPAPLSMQDFVRAAPPPPPQDIIKPLERTQPAPPPPHAAPTAPTVQQQHPPQFQPSPLHSSPADSQRAPTQSEASASLVNPAAAAARSRAADEYFWEVIRKFSQYLPDLREKNQGGTVVVRAVIARDGRLLEASIARSSGVPALDKGMLEALRAGAPYPPLPSEIQGDRIVFTQPITARR